MTAPGLRVRRWVAFALVAAALVGCTRRPAGSIALQLATQHLRGGADSGLAVVSRSDTLALAFGADTLFVTQVSLLVRELEIAPADAGDCEGTPDEHEEECPVLAEGPLLWRLSPGGRTGVALTKRVPPDEYSLLQFQIQTPDSARDARFLADHPQFRRGSIRLEGVYSRRGVRETVDYWVVFNEREELALEPPLAVTRDSTAVLVLQVDVARWFLNAEQSGLVDPGTAGPGQPYASLVRDNIRKSLKAFASASS